MSDYDSSDIDDLLVEILEDEGFKKEMVSDGDDSVVGYTLAEIKIMADELRTCIVNAYLGIVQDPEKYFDISTTEIEDPKVGYSSNKEGIVGNVELKITFDGDGLYRESLYNPDGSEGAYYTGTGVYDIFGLLTRGYATKSVVGFWVNPQTGAIHGDDKILNRRSRVPDAFIRNAVDDFEKKYPGVQITLPPEWE